MSIPLTYANCDVNYQVRIALCLVYRSIVSVRSSFVSVIINALVGVSGRTGFWIGLNKKNQNMLQWIDNSDITYVNWAPGQPSYGVSLPNRNARAK